MSDIFAIFFGVYIHRLRCVISECPHYQESRNNEISREVFFTIRSLCLDGCSQHLLKLTFVHPFNLTISLTCMLSLDISPTACYSIAMSSELIQIRLSSALEDFQKTLTLNQTNQFNDIFKYIKIRSIMIFYFSSMALQLCSSIALNQRPTRFFLLQLKSCKPTCLFPE